MKNIKRNFNFSEKDPPIRGFQEVVFSVYNLERALQFYQEICGWEILTRHKGDTNLKSIWKLEEEVTIEEVVLRNPEDHEGFLRLVKFSNVDQQQIRSGTQIWDSGGIFDVNVRVKDMKTMYTTFQREGWNGYTDPHRFTFGQFDVSEVVLKGHDGITIAAMERFYPPLEGFEFKKVSRIFNSTTVCKNYKKSLAFFTEVLGFKIYFETPGNKRENGKNVIGVPPNINGGITAPVCIVHPEGKNFGSIELLETKELKGKDCSKLAQPPNLGILMLRFPVKDAEVYAKKIIDNGGKLNTEVQVLEINPYGKIKAFSVRTPDGVWLEFLETID
ncbi:VOC family protein [uncultured Maribacter sp.]|uniref:VOC family protein n=1 Tax=uncultured Maribacter sp. TaxID=431308 RepID=UPI00262FB7C6|nr:VOC family protein [uncultured Maribacter sp.]